MRRSRISPRLNRRPSAGRLLLALLAAAPFVGCAAESQSRSASADERIRYYSRRVDREPRLYPVHVQLAEAFFDKAREEHEPAHLAKARESLARSLSIQPTFEAFLLEARLATYAHRFAVALDWAKRAAEAAVYPNDPAVTAITVEALLGLGRADEARRLLPAAGAVLTDFHTAAALGRYLAEAGDFDPAHAAYVRAAALAREAGVPRLAAWAQVMAAGTLIDSGRPEAARPHLGEASRLGPKTEDLRMHEAELLEATGRAAEALAAYEDLRKDSADPVVPHRAYRLARALGEEGRAERYLREAERGYLGPVAAGEVYTLGALAQLYADAGIHLERALDLARENLKYKADAEAVATLAAVRARLGS